MGGGKARVLVWDWTIRLFHWSIVGLVVALWWTAEQGFMDWHRRAGLAVLGLLVYRIYWGLVGSSTARFSQFIKGPGVVLAYLGKLGNRPYRPAFGHNPAGALSVIVLLILLVAQVVFGLFAIDVDGLESGPLARFVSFDRGRWFSDLHELTFNLLAVMVLLHLAAIFGYLLLLKTNLVRPMVTGRRPASDDSELVASTGVGVSWLKAIVGVVIALSVVWGVLQV